MLRDARILEEMEEALRLGRGGHAICPALRFYTWEAPTVSLGCSQAPDVALGARWEEWLRTPLEMRKGPTAIVRRPTGGRAVWHEDELTYAVILPRQHPCFLAGKAVEQVLGEWLLEGARRAGVRNAGLKRGEPGRNHLGIGISPCFASTGRYEITWCGRKWIGSARRITSHALLQHGSIRLGPGGDRLWEWLTGGAVADPRPWSELPGISRLADGLESAFRELLEDAEASQART